jgi:signal transduction histidine kinase
MVVWIYWYVKNSRNLTEFAKRLPPELLESDFNWVVLVEGGVLMLMILAGVYVIFVYWNKQARLYQLQSNFVSSVSHELKSPLASIQLYLETLKYQNVSQKDALDFVETMLSDTERLSDLIDNILESSKSDPKSMQLQFKLVDVVSFLRETMEHHKRLFEDKQCLIELKFDNQPKVSMDIRAMRMVFNNLIVNALRFSSCPT